MDIPDVSAAKEYLEMLTKLKVGLQAASKRKGQVPTDRKPRAQVIKNQMENLMSSAFMEQMDLSRPERLLHSSFLPPPYLPSITSLKDLKKILIRDMQLETHHRGFYALLRAVTPSHRMTAVLTIVEDEKGDVTLLQLYQQEHEEVRSARDIFKPKGVCIVKEPYFKIASDGNYALRVDHVSDLVWLREEDDRVPECWRPQIIELDKSAGDWKQEGNTDFEAGNFHDAVEKYTLALQVSTSAKEADVIKLNRSLANLKLRRYDAALLDTKRTPAGEISEKGLFRAALAFYGLAKFQDCGETLELLLQKYPTNAAARKELSRVKDRLREQGHGEYNFKSMYEATKIMPLSLDSATYLGSVEVKSSVGRGRGLFSTRAVKTGELLLCEKAFSHCYADEKGKSSRNSLLMDTDTNRMTMGTSGYLITEIVQKLHRNPSQMSSYLSLHRGSYQPTLTNQVDGQPVIDTFLVARIEALNAFGCPLTSLNNHFGDSTEKSRRLETIYYSSGIWIYASQINHSCYSNVRRSFIGDMQIVRASRDIPADTELVFKYNAPDLRGYKEHQAKLQHWGFECTCVICFDWKNTPKQHLKKRNALLGDLKTAFPASRVPDISKAERLLAALEKTYRTPSTLVPRLALYDSYCAVFQIYVVQNQPEKVLPSVRKFLHSLGFMTKDIKISGAAKLTSNRFVVEQWGLMCDPVVEAFLSLWVAYAIVAPELTTMAESYAKMAYKICVGEDDTFDEVVGGKVKEAITRRVCFWAS